MTISSSSRQQLTYLYNTLKHSGLFDERWYLNEYRDVRNTGLDPLLHYCLHGERMRYSPCFYFDIEWYSSRNSDVKADGISPLLHYVEFGDKEGRSPSMFFDTAWYRRTYDISDSELALRHYIKNSRNPLFSPLAEFDKHFYTATYPDVALADIDPYEHFVRWGCFELRCPSSAFDTRYYYQSHIKGDTSRNAFIQYLSVGRERGLVTFPDKDKPSVAGEIRRFTAAGPLYEDLDLGARRNAILNAKLVAFYLPQFHAIPENDAFWGTGFTEWRNLSRGVPRFAGHYQPRIPRDGGFYDLGDGYVLERHAELAQSAGIHAFCFYFYWFNGRTVLEKPLNDFAKLDTSMPFCIMWANENWTRRWDGMEAEVLLRQDYHPEHEEALLDTVAGYLAHPRYLRAGNRPLLLLYRPAIIPDARETIARWRAKLAERLGVEPLLLMAQAFGDIDPTLYGLDGAFEFPPHKTASVAPEISKRQHILDWSFDGQVFDFDAIADAALNEPTPPFELIKTVLPSWDNDARRQGSGLTVTNSTPQLYERWLRRTIAIASLCPFKGERFVFINAWNEWCEGAYLEPDVYFGSAYLNATARAVSRSLITEGFDKPKIALVGHDAFPAGAQLLLLNIARVFATSFGLDIQVLLLNGGELLASYQQICPVTLCTPDNAQEVIAGLAAVGFKLAITNTAASGWIIPALKDQEFRVISLIHEMPNLIHEYGLQAACQFISGRSDQVVFSSHIGKRSFCESFPVPPERSLLLAQGLYKDVTYSTSARDRIAKELGLPTVSNIIVGVGYGDLRKGIDLFVQAAFKLRHHPLAPHFVWVGALDPAVRTWLAGDAQRAGLVNLHFIGQKPDLSDYLSAADVMLLPSREDPYPTVVMEALAAGVPVIAFEQCGGFVELLDNQDLGHLIPFGDLDALVAAVVSICQRPDEERQVKRSLRISFASERFNFNEYAFSLLRMLRKRTEAVSVIVPNYNYAGYLEDRLTSIANQSYPIRELIVLDDASKDESMTVLSAFREKTGIDWKLIANDTNCGNVFRQWKRGLEVAKGDFIWIAEADDLSFSGFIERMIDMLTQHPNASFAFCDSLATDADSHVIYEGYQGYYDTIEPGCFSEDRVWNGREFISKYLSVKNLIMNASSVIWRRNVLCDAFTKVGIELFDYRVAGDWRLYVEAANLGSVAFCASRLNVHRRHKGSVTHHVNERQHYEEICRVQNAAARYVDAGAELCAKILTYRKEIREYFGMNHDAR